jgi:hypothetical protein
LARLTPGLFRLRARADAASATQRSNASRGTAIRTLATLLEDARSLERTRVFAQRHCTRGPHLASCAHFPMYE